MFFDKFISIHPVEQLVLLVPSASSEGSQRVKIDPDIDYDAAIIMIYQIIGCASVVKKPDLMYRLSTSTQKVDPISLKTEDDWQGCLEDVAAAERKSKNSVVVAVKILITDQVSSCYCYVISKALLTSRQYLLSLRAHTKKAPSNKRKSALMNLDNDEDDDETNEAMEARERIEMEKLDKALSQCQLCGSGKACKIDNSGSHVHLTFQQRRSWSVALVSDISCYHDAILALIIFNQS